MKTKLWMLSGAAALAAGAALLADSPQGYAADHGDAPNLATSKAADINDVYAWMSEDAAKVNLVMTVVPFAATGEGFSSNVQYVFHVNRMAAFGATTSTETLIICEFASAIDAQCWMGDTYVSGDFSGFSGVTSADGRLKVFAGPRNDPFFFHLSGFRAAAATVQTALTGSYPPGGTGCPTGIGAVTAEARGELTGSPTDFFAGFRVHAIVLQVDKAAFAGSGDVIGVWASTHTKPAS